MMKKLFVGLAFVCGLIVLMLSSCRRDNFFTGNNAVLQFSTDTLTFDTVFTTVGTITRFFKVENTSRQTLLIEEIRIAEGDASPFRINVDGITVQGSSISNVEIPGNDYIYIFVEATLGANNSGDPLVIINELQYFYNNVMQSSYLQAWGQDAYFHFGEIYEGENVVWTNDKPHVVVRNTNFPGVGVDSFSTLTIMPGTRVFTTFGAGIFVDGRLIVGEEGNRDSVVFQSDRIQTLPNGLSFENNAGLWYGIALLDGAYGYFHNVVINQATYGISGRFVSGTYANFGNASRPEIILDKVIIKNSLQNALIGLNSNITAKNCLFYNSGNNLVVLALGGEYTIDNCTFYNAGSFGLSHKNEILALSNFAQNQNGGAINTLEKADITNTIVHGTLVEEILLSNLAQAGFNYTFTNCLVKTEIDIDADNNFINCIRNLQPQFMSTSDFDFRLSQNSPCIDAGIDNGITDDLDFRARTLPPDIGAFEF
jgi:hypothetical protein